MKNFLKNTTSFLKNITWSRTIEVFVIAAFMFVISAGAYSLANLGVFNNIENAIQVFEGLGWFVGCFLLATLFTAYLVVIADTKFLYRFLAIPTWLMFSFTLLVALDQFLGYTYPALPPQAELLSYRVIRDPDTNVRIVEAWMYLKEENRTRAYRFPYDKDQEEALYKAMRAKARGKTGVEVELMEKPKDGDDRDRPRPEDMIKYDIRHKGLPEKHYGDGEMIEERTEQGANAMGQERREDKIIIQIPGGGSIEVDRGTSFTITPDGEVEILDPGSIERKQEKGSSSSSGAHPSESNVAQQPTDYGHNSPHGPGTSNEPGVYDGPGPYQQYDAYDQEGNGYYYDD